MYSPNQDFTLDGTSHTTVGAVPVARNNRVFPSSPYHHQRQSSFGAASIAMSPPNVGRPIPFGDPNAQNWFGTSMDSSSSFGQSPNYGGRDLIVSPSTSTGQVDGFAGTDQDDESQQRNLQDMFEKRRRRRESHNAVERRRRDNINERIHELSTLLPEHLLEMAPASSNVIPVTGGPSMSSKAINKGTILKLSVEHIKDLKDEVVRYKERVKELEKMIEAAKQGSYASPTERHFNSLPSDTAPAHARNDEHRLSQPVKLMEGNGRSRHERVGSLQFQQQFGNLHIGNHSDDTNQA